MYDDDDDFLGKDPAFIKQVHAKVENEAKAKPEPAKAEPAKVEQVKPAPVIVKAEPVKVEQAKPSPKKVEQAKPAIAKVEPAKVEEVKPEPLQDDDDDFLSKDTAFIKQVQAKVESKVEATPEPAEVKFTNVPMRDGDDDAIYEREIKVKVISSGESVLADIEKAQEKLETEAENRYDDIVLSGKNLSILAKFLWGIFIFAASVLGIFMLANIVDFVESLAAITPVLRYFFIALMLLFSGVIIGLVVKICLSLKKFSKACDIDLSTIKSLSEREEFKKAAKKDYIKVKSYLLRNLQAYETSYLEKLKLGDDDVKAIRKFKNDLISLDSAAISSRDWIEKYQSLFESKLTEVAKRRIVQYAKQVGYSTAISPFPFLDRLIVLSATLAMIKDVFAIYNLKLGKLDSMKLFAMSISSVYFSGIAQEGAVSLSDGLFGSEFMSQMGLSAVGTTAGKIILPKLSEGSINGFLIWRLGKFILKKLNLK